MATALLDTNAVSALMHHNSVLIARINAFSDPVVSSVIVVGEIRFGLSQLPLGNKRTALEVRMSIAFAGLPIEPVTVAIAHEYGQLRAITESRGLNIGVNDIWIAATAITLGCVLVTNDRLLSTVPGVVAEDWTV